MSETLLIVALCKGSSYTGSVETGVGSSGIWGEEVGFMSDRRGTWTLPSSFPSKMRDSRLRVVPLTRGWVGLSRDLDRFPRELMKTRVGRVGGSIRVIFFATWISAFSTEKMDDGDGERDR